MLKKLASLVVALLMGYAAHAQLQAMRQEHQLNLDTFRLDLMRLTSPAFAGRGTGQEGYQMAADFIASKLLGAGIMPIEGERDNESGNPYFHEVPYRAEKLLDASLEVAGKRYALEKDFYPAFVPNMAELKASELVFVGFGQDDDYYSDLGGQNIKGKVVVAMPGKVNAAGELEEESWRNQYQRLVKAGPALIILANPAYKDESPVALQRLMEERIRLSEQVAELAGRSARNVIPTLVMKPKAMKKLLKSIRIKQSREQRKRIAAASGTVIRKPAELLVRFKTEVREFVAPNVAGMIRGSEFTQEYVVISAHLDHLGMHDGEIYYGADDNGSGSAALLSLARQYQTWFDEGILPRRNIVLLWFSGEENGLLGSRYFAENAPIATDMIIANINVDMIGRNDPKHKMNENYVYLIGADRLSQELHDIGEAVNEQCCEISLDYTFNDPKDPNRYYYRSDHYNFAKQGIPSVFVFSGVHEDYHKPTDTIDKIDFDRMKRVSELILYLGWELAGREARLKIK